MSLHVLLVEPDAGFADEIRRALAPAGFAITAVASGEPAVERCREAAPDLILLAAELPDMSGFSVCNRLKRVLASVPLILYTGEATDAAIEAHRATRTRADDYLKKPFDLAELLGRAAALLNADAPAPPPPPAPPAAPRLDGRRHDETDPPPVLKRVDSGQVAARGLAAAMAAAAAPPPARAAASSAAQAPAPPAPAAPAAPPRAAARPGPPPVPPPVPAAKPPQATIAKVKTVARSDPSDVLADWPRDPAPPKGTPDEKLEYFRDRLRARDVFLAKVRDAIAEMKARGAELSGERDGLEAELATERDRAGALEHRLAEASQDAAAQAARIEDLQRRLDESEATRRSLSEVLNETMQQQEAAEQQAAARIAAAEETRARLEAELADAREGHDRAVAAMEADRADERARFEQARAEAEEAHARELAALDADRARDADDAAMRVAAADVRMGDLAAEGEGLRQEIARLEAEVAARGEAIAARDARLAEATDSAREEGAVLRARLDEADGRSQALAGELEEARRRIEALEAEAGGAAEARVQLDEMLRHARAETRAYEEKAVAAEHAFQAKAAELTAAEQRIRDLGSALDEGRASFEGTRGELARVDAARGEAERRAAQAAAARDQLAKEVEAARRDVEAERERARRLEVDGRRLDAEVQRLAKLEPVAEEASRLRKHVASLEDLVQQRTKAAESASRAAQGAAAERARAEERLAVDSGRLQSAAQKLDGELAASRRKIAELEAERTQRAAELEKARAELTRASGEHEARRHEKVSEATEAEKRHAGEVTRLKAALVELEKHLEARARAELAMKKRVSDLEKAAQAPKPPPVPAADPTEIAKLRSKLAKVAEEIEDLRSENDFLNGEVARYVQKNKDLAAQVASLKES